MADKVYKVSTSMGNSWKVTSQIRQHQLVIDQPSGGDEGANPLETFLFSLGGCISAIAKMVARDMKIDLKGIDVHIEATLNPAGLAGKPTDDPVGFKSFSIVADIDADINEALKQELLDLTCHRCPIHDNIVRASLIEHRVG